VQPTALLLWFFRGACSDECRGHSLVRSVLSAANVTLSWTWFRIISGSLAVCIKCFAKRCWIR